MQFWSLNFSFFTLKMRMEFCLTNFELYLIKPWLKKATKKGGVGGRIYYLVKNDLGRGPTPLALFPAHCHKHSLKNKKFIKKSWPNCWCIVNTCFNFSKSPQNHLNLTILRGRYGTNFDLHNIGTLFATTCLFFIQIHQTKFYKTF